MDHDDQTAGFSTMEMLVAFVILSLGLGLAVQSISQASMSLKRASESTLETVLLRRVMSEELPRLVKSYDGKPLMASGLSWQVSLLPLSNTDLQGPIQAIIRIAPREGGAYLGAYTSVFPLPPPDNPQNNKAVPQPAGQPQ